VQGGEQTEISSREKTVGDRWKKGEESRLVRRGGEKGNMGSEATRVMWRREMTVRNKGREKS
jgi:hypothetical protein